jgi:uncharacterized protein YggT (Ycf19 family)
MSLVDFILNIAGLLLWLNWRALPLTSPTALGASLVSTLRPAGPTRPRFYYLGGLLALLLARALFYWQIGEPIHWNPRIPLGPTTVGFRSDVFGRMLFFSIFSFGVTLGIFYLCLLLLSWIQSRAAEADPSQRLVRAHLGMVGRWPVALKVLLPLLFTAVAWCLLNPLLVNFNMVPRNVNPAWHIVAQGALIGLAAYLVLKFFLVAVLALYLLNSYVYLGEFPFWNFINATARGLLRPIKWLPLRAGKIDFAPVLLIVVVLAGAQFSQRALTGLFQKLI